MILILKKFFGFCAQENRRLFYNTLVIGVLIAICEASKFPAIYIILDGFISNSISVGRILTGFMILVVSVIIESFLRGISTMMQCKAGYRECAGKRIEIAEHLRYLPMGYFNKNSLGEITTITTNVMEQLGDVAMRVVMLTTQGIINTAIIVLMILAFDWRIGIICIVGIILFSLINHTMRNANAKLTETKLEVDTKVISGVLEYIQGISEVKAYNMLFDSRSKLEDTIRRAGDTNMLFEKICNRYIPFQNIVMKLTGVAILVASIGFYLNGSMELLTAIVMMIMSFMVFSGLEAMGSYSAILRVVDLCVERGREVLNLDTMDISGEECVAKTNNIEVSGIDFAYGKKKIIDNISLRIKEKTTVAFVGPSGGGKTTLCHLIARFWDVDKGAISLGEKNVKEYSMVIGEKGASLSGGEKQRISIARAIMKDAPVIILDEATANVDPENEKELMQAIYALTEEKTILMIAHRLKTIRNADQIFVIDKGQIVQSGTHDTLMKQDGIYKQFVESRVKAIGWKIDKKK